MASICANLLEQKKAFTQEGVEIPQDWIRTPTWPPFHCFGTPIWPPCRHVKTQYFFHNSEWYSKSISKHEGCINCVIQLRSFQVMLHGMIRNVNCLRNTTLECPNNVVTIRKNVGAMLLRLHCAKNRRCESSRKTSPLMS